MSVPPDGGSPSVDDPRGDPQPKSDASEDADVHAFLIADVRGWTSFTQERGDEEAARLAARFAEVTRELVEQHRGRLVELRGDEALVVFGSPRSAIRAAVALQERFVEETTTDPSLPLTIGIGLDAGEAVPVEGGYRGGALNVAARLCSQAHAGEVIASREIVHLARRLDGVRFTERGHAQLKGLEQPVHMVAVRSEHRDAAEAIAPFVRSTAPPPTAHRRRKMIAGAVAFAVLIALVAVPLALRGGSSEIAPNSIGILDPESGDLKKTLPLGENARPGSIAVSAEDVWVTNPDVGTVTRILPDTDDVRDPVVVGENPTEMAVGGNIVWVVESGASSVSRINTDTKRVEGDAIMVGNGPAGIAVDEAAVWVTNRFDGTVSRIDPNSGEVIKTIPVGLDPRGIASGFGSVWVGLAGSNTVVRIDPATNEVTQQVPVGNGPGAMAVSADAVWIVNTLDDTVSRISPDTNSVVDVVPVGDGPSGIAVVDGSVWVANEADGSLSRIEPGQTPDETSARSMAIGSIPQGLADVGGELWVSVGGTATTHRGGALGVVSLFRRSDLNLDSTTASDGASWSVLHLLGDGLVAFEPIGGADPALVPDLAVSVPTPTDAGQTYTFQLRPGIRYSNGEVVAPGDFRRALERGFRLNRLKPDPHANYYGGLVGADACVEEPSTCDLSEGILTDDATGTVTFKLLTPDPEFLYKLTLPFAYPVPPSAPDEEQVRVGIPGTGPYMIDAEKPKTHKGLTVVRNPYFRVWSPAAQPDGYVDRIDWTFRVEPSAQLAAVKTGDADVAFDAARSPAFEGTRTQFAAQVYASSVPATYFAVLNTQKPPFDDRGVRRAMNFALDRAAIFDLFGGPTQGAPGCQQIPPNFPGYERYCPYTKDPGAGGKGVWTAPDTVRATRLVDRSHTAGMQVVVEYPDYGDEGGVALADYMVELLKDLGYDGRAKAIPLDDFYDRRNEFQVALAGWGEDYPAASDFITNFFTCNASVVPSAGFCNKRIDRKIEDATQKQLDDPAAAGALWAEIDRLIVDEAPYVWIGNQIQVTFVSERTGNYQYSPQWGGLLNQLWVR